VRTRSIDQSINQSLANRDHARTGLVDFKLGQHIGGLPPDEIAYILERSYLILWLSEFLYAWSIFLSKMAVLTFYRRIFGVLPIRWPIYALSFLCIAWILIRTFVSLFRCTPIQFYWDKSLDGHCAFDSPRYYFGTDLTHTLLDTIILALPIFEVLKMKLPTGQKVAVVGLFSCGFLYVLPGAKRFGPSGHKVTSVCIASAFQIISSGGYDPNSVELPFQLTLGMVWASVEAQMAVFSSMSGLPAVATESNQTDLFLACLPLLRPILQKFIPGLSTTQHTYGTNTRASFALPTESRAAPPPPAAVAISPYDDFSSDDNVSLGPGEFFPP
jgi:hypothetical protein